METKPPAAAGRRYQTHIAVLVAAAAVTIAVLGARTSELSGDASASWQSAVRAQVRQSATKIENRLYLYGDPVTTATQYRTARIRAEQYHRELRRDDLTPTQRKTLVTLAGVEDRAAAVLRGAVAGRAIVGGRDDGAFDLAGRLAAEQRTSERVLAGAREVREVGDRRSSRALVEALVAVPAALAFLLGSAARARPQSARTLLLAGGPMLAASLIAALAVEAVPF